MGYRLSATDHDPTSADNRTVHPCPYCEEWQVDFHFQVAQEWVVVSVSKEGEVFFDTKPWYDALDEVIQEHWAEKHKAALRFFQATGKILPAARVR